MMAGGGAQRVPVVEDGGLPPHLAALMRALHEPAALVRAPDRIFLDVNPAFERLLGRPRGALVGRSVRVIHVSERAYEEFGAKLAHAVSSGSFSVDWPLIRGDGERFLARMNVAPVHGADGAPYGFVGTVQDLTHVRATEARARLLADASEVLAAQSLEPEAILRSLAKLATRHLADHCVVDLMEPQGTLRRVEVAHRDPAHEATLLEYQRRFPPSDAHVAALRAAPRGSRTTRNHLTREQLLALVGDEERVRVLEPLGLRHLLTVPLHDRKGVAGALTFGRTGDEPFARHDEELALELCARAATAYENAHLHRQLADVEAKWRSIVANASDWIYLADREGIVHFINRGHETIPIDQIVGRSLYSWLDASDAARVREVYESVFRTGRSASVTTSATIEGREAHYEMRIGPVLRDSEVVAATVTTIDITQRHASERALNELAERERQQAEVLETLHRVHLELARSLDLERVVQVATDAATTLTGAAFGAFFYNVDDGKGGKYTLYTISGVPREAFSKFPMPRNTAVFAPTFAGTGIVRSDDITKDPRYGHNAPHHGMPKGHLPVRSYLAVPVVSREGTVHGGLFFGHPEPARFAPQAETLAVGIAAQTAIALDNAHLYRRVKENGERLLEREAQLAQAQAIAHLGSWTSDLATGALTWSDENYRIHGIPIGAPITFERMLAIVHPEDRPAVEAHRAAMLAHGDATAEYRLLAGAGVKHVQARGRVVLDAEGRARQCMGTTLDITERKVAEAALRESEERFRTLVTATTQMVWRTDPAGMIEDLPEWRAFTGQSIEQVRGGGWIDAVHPEDRARVRSAWAAAYAARAIYEAEYRVRSKEGEHRWFIARAVPRLDEHGELVEYIGTWTDITQERQALQEAETLRLQLAQNEKSSALGSLVGGVAHEIRTPLTYLSNNLALVGMAVERVLREVPPPKAEALKAKLDARLADANESIERIDRIVEDLRRYTRLKSSAERTSASLSVLVADGIHLFRATHRGQIVVVDELQPTRPVLGDRVQVQQVVLNLLQNAVEARPADDRVVVRTRDTPEGAVLEVEDHGDGIPPHVLARVWDPFFTTKTEGSGLGLSVVRRIIDAHHGRIGVESEPGKGTRFRITFPHAP